MPMIQGIDGGLLINALRQGREDRYNDDQRRMKAAAQKTQLERQAKVTGLMGQLFGPSQSGGGVMAMGGGMAPSVPAEPAGPTASMADQFMPSVGADTQGAVDRMAAMPSAPAPTGRGEVNQDVLRQLLVLDPETFSSVVTGLKNMDETQIKREQVKNDARASAAMYLRRIPLQQRAQVFQQIMPDLMRAGWTQQELANIDLDNQSLAGHQAFALDYDKALDQDRKEREFRAGKTVAVAPGGSVALVKPTMNDAGEITGTSQEYIIGGSGASTTPTNLPRPATKEDRDALPPGAKYIDPEGNVRTKPGGPTPAASGGFQGQ